MRALFDLVHPADALFFHHAMRMLRDRGVQIRVVSRRKDVLVDLLDALGVEHTPLTTARGGLLGQACELVARDIALFRMARAWKPHVMAGFGGVAISHVGKLLGIPSVSFYDTEHASVQIRLTLPFISEWHVPGSWTGALAPGRTRRFPGSKQFAYLHPGYFRPDAGLAKSAGWDPAVDNFLVRTVSWQANHDIGSKGMGLGRLREIVGWLAGLGKVHISAEGTLPPDLRSLQFRGSASSFHHLLAHCRLHVGESMTVASEATALGVPALLQNSKECAYISEQENAGLIRRIGPGDDFAAALRSILEEHPEEFRKRCREFAASSGDLNSYIADTLERAGRA